MPRPRTLTGPTMFELHAMTNTWFRVTPTQLTRARKWATNNGYVVVVAAQHALFRPIAAEAGQINMEPAETL